jgi:hypothetical protein
MGYAILMFGDVVKPERRRSRASPDKSSEVFVGRRVDAEPGANRVTDGLSLKLTNVMAVQRPHDTNRRKHRWSSQFRASGFRSRLAIRQCRLLFLEAWSRKSLHRARLSGCGHWAARSHHRNGGDQPRLSRDAAGPSRPSQISSFASCTYVRTAVRNNDSFCLLDHVALPDLGKCIC